MDNKQELRRRWQAIRLRLRGIPHKQILKKVHRSRAWLSKWQARFDREGRAGLRSRSRRPRRTPRAYPARIARLIVQTRRRLLRQRVGLVGARAIQRELRPLLGKQTPSRATISRVLQAQHLVRPQPARVAAYFPKPLTVVGGVLHALDWTCRYLAGGPKVYAFHTLNLRTRACTQTIATNKRTTTVVAHCLLTWQTLGIPDFLQLDNDAAFCGGYKAPRVFGHFVRLCLFLGLELIFLPVAEPRCNGEVEALNGLWAHAFWERHHFTAVRWVARASPTFVQWYLTRYAPPHLAGQTPAQAQQHEPKRRLTPKQQRQIPDPLPLTAGRIHFIRRVQPDGTITLFNETWPVSRRLADRYVWATLTTHTQRLDIWYQPAVNRDWRLLKTYPYDIPETVVRLKPEFAHHHEP